MGVGGKGGSAPSAPNYQAAATPNQTNAFGVSSKWGQSYDQPMPGWVSNPDNSISSQLSGSGGHNQAAADAWKQAHGQMSQTQSFGGPLGDAATGLQGQFAAANANPLDNGAQARQHAEDAIYSRETARLDPMFAQREGSLRTQLLNQGLDPGSQGARTEMDTFNRGRNDAYSSALQDAISGGGAEAQRQQGMDLQSRMAPLMGLQGMNSLTGQSQNPLLAAAMGQYQGALQNYGMQQQGKNSSLGGLMNLGGTLGAAKLMAPVP